MRVRHVTRDDAHAVRQVLLQDPVTHCFVASRIQAANGLVDVDPWRIGGELLGAFDQTGLRGVVYAGANLVPIQTDSAARQALAEHLVAGPRRSSSIVGPAEEVLDLWARLESRWGPAREVRTDQPLLQMAEHSRVPADPAVRRVRTDELELLLPACVAMFTEEVGISPMSGGMASAYRSRVAEIIGRGHAFARIEDDHVLFKAEIGADANGVCQVQGVWVDPARRGEGLSVGGMAAVVEHARASYPCVSLYVNHFNHAARAAYSHVGFRAVGTFATVLF